MVLKMGLDLDMALKMDLDLDMDLKTDLDIDLVLVSHRMWICSRLKCQQWLTTRSSINYLDHLLLGTNWIHI